MFADSRVRKGLRAAGRLHVVGKLLLGLVALLPLVAFFLTYPPVLLRVLVVGFLALALVRPPVALLAVAALTPFGGLLGRLTGFRWSVTEPLVLAFLAGWLVREAVRTPERGDDSVAGRRPALALAGLFAVSVAASAVVQLVVLQVSTSFPLDFLSFVLRFLCRDYYTTEFATVTGAAFLLEGLGVFAAALVLAARQPRLVSVGAKVIVGAAALVAAVNVGTLARPEEPRGSGVWAAAGAPVAGARNAAPNTVRNSGFEYGDLTGWEKYDPVGEATAGLVDVSYSYEGAYCYYISWKEDSTGAKGIATLPGAFEGWQAGAAYVVSFYAKTAVSPMAAVRMRVGWRTPGEAGGEGAELSNPGLTASYQRYAFRLRPTAAKSGEGANFVISIAPPFSTPANVLYIDAVKVERGTEATAYVPLAEDARPVPFSEASTRRVSRVFPDVNAAGSYFVMVLFVGVSLAASSRGRERAVWVVAACLAVAGLWFSGSRTALAAALLVGTGLVIAGAARRGLRAVWRPGAGVLALAVLAATLVVLSERGAPSNLRIALEARQEMAGRGLKMFREHAVLGIGPGRFFDMSLGYPPEKPSLFPGRENAHNNFVQLLAELGVVGFACLVALLFGVLIPPRDPAGSPASPPARPLSAGILAFILTWMAGHPLLVREVALAFWLALGFCAAVLPVVHTPSLPTPDWARRRRRAAILAILALIPAVADYRLARADLTREGRGFSQWHRDVEGARFRWMLRDAVLYVPASARQVAIPIRSPAGPATVKVILHGVQVSQLIVSDTEWREVRLEVPRNSRWKSVPVALRALLVHPTGLPRGVEGDARGRIQVGLPRVLD